MARASIHTLRPLPELDYHDSRSVLLPVQITALQAWNLMTAGQGPLMRLAFRTRDGISSLLLPVGPAHKLIVNSYLKRLKRKLQGMEP